MKVGCGRCIGCRLDHAQAWSVRIMHEAKMHEDNCFLTLTYKDLPPGGGLVKSDFQKFMRALRQAQPKYQDETGKLVRRKLRFFHCGEYGDAQERPHYHAIIFGLWFRDSKLAEKTKSGAQQWKSATLDRLWKHGRARIGTVTHQSANYVARYIMKKVNGEQAEHYYQRLDPVTGELHPVIPEYVTMSNRPGIGHDWFTQFGSDVYPSDFCLADGRKVKPPRYYDKLLRRKNAELLAQLKAYRRRAGINSRNIANSKPARLAVRETVAKSRASLYKREPT